MFGKILVAGAISIVAYTLIGTNGNVDVIKQKAPQAIIERGWELMRYEGYQYGSWSKHGGKVWYHVRDKQNPNIQYRVHVTMWNNELQFYYREPEQLSRVQVNLK